MRKSDSESSVDQALSDAEFGISQLDQPIGHFEFYLRATLVPMKGVLDFLLYEYNEKFGLGINEDNLSEQTFRERANSVSHTTAQQFIRDYSAGWTDVLNDDSRVSVILRHGGTRDRLTHRGLIPKIIQLELQANIALSVNVEARNPDGKIVGVYQSSPSLSTSDTAVRYFLAELQTDDIVDLCNLALGKLRTFVKDLRIKYG